jgi:rhodanese-related sulfurtransferase
MMVCVISFTLPACAGCSQPEPAPTACPIPALPQETVCPAPLAPTLPPEPVAETDANACQGGSLTASQAFELLDDAPAIVTFIDTRLEYEYANGHIPGAVNMPSNDAAFWDQVRALPREGTYVVYCRTGSATRAVVTQMVKDGFVHVCQIGVGFNGWASAGFPGEQEPD